MTQLLINMEFDGDVKTIGTVEELDSGEIDSSIAAFVKDVVDSLRYGNSGRSSERVRIFATLDEKGNSYGI